MFDINAKFLGEGLTFDDVLGVPGYSKVLPKDVNVKTRFSRNITLNIPLVSAAMDTVTEARLAIAIAREGGIGVLHKNMSIKRQAAEVVKVKRAQSAIIMDPITVYDTDKLGKVFDLRKRHKFGGFPVVDKDNKIVGIITTSDVKFQENREMLVAEVMTKDPITIKMEDIQEGEVVDLAKAKEIFRTHKKTKLLVTNNDQELVGLITSKDVENLKEWPNANTDNKGQHRVAAAVGTAFDTMKRIRALTKAGVDAIVIDTAHAHSIKVIEILKEAKRLFKNVDFVVGNIVTAEAAKMLYEAGADAVKVGIGPGSICTTRIIAGIGYPQLSAIMLIAQELQGKIPIIADGGIRYSGDIVKALIAGADSIMAGSLFGGCEESPGETIIFQGRKFKAYRGMGSIEAMQKGSADRYHNDGFEPEKMVPEGIVSRIPFKGLLSEVVYQLIGGVRSGMGYTGSADITALQQAKFVKITSAGMIESHPHDVTITNESPNYSK